MNLHETIMGKRLIEGTLPDIAHQLKRIADSLEKLTESKEVVSYGKAGFATLNNDWLENRLNGYGNTNNDLPKKRGEGTAQAILDYVDMKGAVSHKELHEYYKSLNGSNTFSWCLKNLRIPYKNRKTQRYLAKEGKIGSNAKWVVKVANPSNWVVIEY
jgi:hypothetical protein